MSLAQILANVEQLQKEQADIYDSGQRYSDQLAPGAYGRLGDQMFIDQTDGGTFKDPYFESLMYGNPNLIEDYFSTGRFENFNPRVGILASPQVQNTSIDSIDYDEENGEIRGIQIILFNTNNRKFTLNKDFKSVSKKTKTVKKKSSQNKYN